MINLKNSEQVSAMVALIIAIIFAFMSFYDTDAETYLFPRIIAVVLAILSIALFISDWSSTQDTHHDRAYVKHILPGLVIGLVYLLIMEELGFYVSSWLAFLVVLLAYGGDQPILNPKTVLIKATASLGFMVILYLLFWNGLNVRTPTGILF